MSKIFHSIADEALFTRDILGAGITQVRKANYGERGKYFEAFSNISIGLERIGKLCLILNHYIDNDRQFPSNSHIKNIGHNLIDLYKASQEIVTLNNINFKYQESISDSLQLEILEILSKFAKGDRYSNIDFLLKGNYSNDPIKDWYKKIDTKLYEIRVSKRKKEKIESNATIIGVLLRDSASVRHFGESGENITDIERASFLTGMNESISKYRQLYILQIVRYWVEIILYLNHKAIRMRFQEIPHLNEMFHIFFADDSYFLSRKRYDRN